jgi:hypothetical protein
MGKKIKRKFKSKWNYKKDYCDYQKQTWCELPKYKKCKDCIRLSDGTKACEVVL